MMKTRLLFTAAVAAAGLSACHPAATGSQAASSTGAVTAAAASSAPVAATSATAPPQAAAAPSGGTVTGVSTGPGGYILQAMPAGTVSFLRASDGRIEAQVSMFGLAPGSAHQVSADSPAGPPLQVGTLTAGAAGQASAVFTVPSLPAGSRLVVLLGAAGGGPLAGEPAAESPVLPLRPQPGTAFPLHPVAAGGTSSGEPAGRAQITYDPAAQTLTVTLTASGLTPGPHAAHIHLGSCQDQGPVKYMLADFTAGPDGNITRQVRVVTGVTSAPGPGLYLNVHLGGMSQILSNGTPTLLFQPVLCTDLTSVAVPGGSEATPSAVTAAPSVGMPAASWTAAPAPAGTSPSGMPPATTVPAGPAPSTVAGTHF